VKFRSFLISVSFSLPSYLTSGKEPPVLIEWGPESVFTFWWRETPLSPARNRHTVPWLSSAQPSHYTDYAVSNFSSLPSSSLSPSSWTLEPCSCIYRTLSSTTLTTYVIKIHLRLLFHLLLCLPNWRFARWFPADTTTDLLAAPFETNVQPVVTSELWPRSTFAIGTQREVPSREVLTVLAHFIPHGTRYVHHRFLDVIIP
jgi:hypothetical protein